MKHAYLIIAHNEFEILKQLIQTLGDERNDIYIHFDRKLNHYPDCRISYARLTFLEEHMDVCWGDIGIADAEFALFDEAYQHGEYSYYHLLSGIDMPLRTQNYTHRFFEKSARGEFVGYYRESISKEIDHKVCRWYLFPRSFKETEGGLAVTKRVLRAGCVRLQSLLGIRWNKDINFRKDTQWLSASNGLVDYLLQQQEEVRRVYTYTFCANEILVQTICWDSSFRDRVYDIHDEGHSYLRMIGQRDNQLEKWKEEDFEVLTNLEALSARKSSMRHIEVVGQIPNKISK